MRSLNVTSLVAAAAVSVLSIASGCVDAESPENAADFGSYFTERGQHGTHQAKLEGNRLFGATMDVSLTPDGSYVGRLNNRVVDLRTEEGKVTGTINSARTELHVQPEGEGFRVRGLFAGALGTLDVTPRVISGTVGRCSYDLKRTGTSSWYSGQEVCGARRMPQLTDVSFPTELASRPPEQQAMLVALFLSKG